MTEPPAPDHSTSWFKKPTPARKKLMSLKVGDSLVVETEFEARNIATVAKRDRAEVSSHKMPDSSGWKVTRTK